MAQNVTITYNGFVLGDGTNYFISELDIGAPPIRQAEQLAAGRDGGFIFNQNYGMRSVSFRVNVFSGTAAQFFIDLRAVRAAFARTNVPVELKINYWDGSERRIDVFPAMLPNPAHTPGNTTNSSFDVSLTAAYPFFKGPTSSIITETLELNESEGFDYPFNYPFDYEAGANNSTYVFNNDGDVPALIKVVFNGPVVTPTLNNLTTGKSVQIETTVTDGNSVSLEYTPSGRLIQDQNGVSYEQYFNGETAFFFVPIGSNTFTFTAATYNTNSSATITLTKFYLS